MRIDRKRKLPATTFMMALPDERSLEKVENAAKQGKEIEHSEIIGMSREEILRTYYLSDQISKIKF